MEGERPLVVTEEYERLGGKKLSLIDVLAQSVGFIGPVFSAAFIIPLIIGVNFAARGAGTSAALAVLLAAVGIFALGWIVAQYAKRIHAAGSLYDYVSNGLGKTTGAAAGNCSRCLMVCSRVRRLLADWFSASWAFASST